LSVSLLIQGGKKKRNEEKKIIAKSLSKVLLSSIVSSVGPRKENPTINK
jgi:hypothetical protein